MTNTSVRRRTLAALLDPLVTSAGAQTVPSGTGQPGRPDPARVRAGTYEVDTLHTQVVWSVNHMGISILQGMFGASGGTLTIDPADPSAAELDVTFEIDQLGVTHPAFAQHLRSSDFFDVERHPTARFAATSVTSSDGNRATMAGNVTIKDRTRPVTIDVEFVGAGMNPMTEQLNIGFDGRTTIRRSDFGLGLAVPLVSDEVDIVIRAAFGAT